MDSTYNIAPPPIRLKIGPISHEASSIKFIVSQYYLLHYSTVLEVFQFLPLRKWVIQKLIRTELENSKVQFFNGKKCAFILSTEEL